jgi:Glycosyl transferases group 1
MTAPKIALIWGHHYDDKSFHTHHTFFEATLRDMAIPFDRFAWPDWQVSMGHDYALYFFIDFDKSLYKLHDQHWCHPRCFYWWDSFHFPFSYVAQITELFDISYMAEYNVAKPLINMGLQTVKWLSPAFYAGLLYPLGIPKDLDFVFLGQPDNIAVVHGKTRKEFVEQLSQHTRSGKQIAGIVDQGIYGRQVNELYNRAKILFDKTIAYNVGTRVFEIIGSGGFALVNRRKVNSGIDDLAIDGHHYISYDGSYDDFIHKFDYYLDHPDERARIATAGHKHFLRNHTYQNRIETIMEDFGLR